MNKEHYAELAMNTTDTICYISDPTTYELYYMNKSAKMLVGIEDESYVGKLCYEVLQGKDAPCDFCTNHIIKPNEFHTWEYHNTKFDIYTSLKDALAYRPDNKPVRIEFARDITKAKREMKDLEFNLALEKAQVQCLEIFQFEIDSDLAISRFLEIVGKFYDSTRAYIFDFDYSKQILVNTYEWCSEGVVPQIDNLQAIPLEYVDDWVEQFNQHGEFYISSLDSDMDKSEAGYGILQAQGINSLLAAPIKMGTQIIGFLGVDDPKRHFNSFELLKAAVFLMREEAEKRKNIEMLERLSFIDTLTGVYNRNKFISIVKEMQNQGVSNLGICFADVNELKRINDTYGHEQGDSLIINTSKTIENIFGDAVYRVGGDEFVVLIPNISKEDFFEKVAELKTLAKQSRELNMSIGGTWEARPTNIHEQVNKADEIMYNEKQSYYRNMASSKRTYSLVAQNKLNEEIEHNKVKILYRPIYNLETGKIALAQCIVQKMLDNGTLVSYNDFADLHEDEGSIEILDNYVLETVIKNQKEMLDKGIDIKVCIKLSNMILTRNDCTAKISALCNLYGVPEKSISIEIKSGLCNLSTEKLENLLNNFKKAGIDVVLDDFGSNCVNINVLTIFDFYAVVLSNEIVADIDKSERVKKLYKSALNLCKSTPNTLTIAKGVSDEAKYNIHKELGCDMAKGSYLSEEVFFEEFLIKVLKDN